MVLLMAGSGGFNDGWTIGKEMKKEMAKEKKMEEGMGRYISVGGVGRGL